MKVLVFLSAVVAVAVAKPGYLGLGYGLPAPIVPADAPDVAAARAQHLAIQAAEAARNTLGHPVVPAAIAAAPVGGPANIVIGPGGVPLDTPEVAAAKAANAVAHANAAARALSTPVDPASGLPLGALLPLGAVHAGILGVPGAVQVAPDGTLLTAQGVPLDTPAVAAGKIADAVAHLQAKARLG